MEANVFFGKFACTELGNKKTTITCTRESVTLPPKTSLDRFVITLYAYKNMTNQFATKIKEKRRELGLSLRKVCESVLNEDNKPISVSYLNDIEQCYRKPPSGKIIIQIAKALELDPEELLNLAGKVDPTVEDAVSKNSEVGVLFRKIVQAAKNDPGVMDRINKEIDKKDDAVGQ